MAERIPFMVRKRAPYNLKKGEIFMGDNGKCYKVTSINDVSFLNTNIVQVIFLGKEIDKNEG